MQVYQRDLCVEIIDCLQKEIDGKQYDFCSTCWAPLEKNWEVKGAL